MQMMFLLCRIKHEAAKLRNFLPQTAEVAHANKCSVADVTTKTEQKTWIFSNWFESASLKASSGSCPASTFNTKHP